MRRVWVALLAAMTGVGGLLLALDGEKTASLDGVALVAATPGASSIEAIFNTRVEIQPGRWKKIIIYSSGSPQGSAATIAEEHKSRGFHGLGYHFVIGNGAGQGDGELHVGYRWLTQSPGAHAAGPEQDQLNQNAIGICLVGNGDRRPYTDSQIRRLIELLHALERELAIPPSDMLLGRDIAATTSPGRFFPEATVRNALPPM